MEPQKFRALLCLSLFCASGFVASVSAEDYISDEDLFEEEVASAEAVSDPLETLNRITFELNDFLYATVVQPIADSYQAVTPEPVQEGASNFFKNLKYPVRLGSNVLQGKFEEAWVETKRFAVNTTLGFAGVADAAENFESLAPVAKEDIGQVLAAWGIGEGPYIVLPLLGPSNLRDLVGLVGDRALDPFSEPLIWTDHWDWQWRSAPGAADFTTSSPQILETYDQMKGSAIDAYSAIKNAYTQFRRAAVEE